MSSSESSGSSFNSSSSVPQITTTPENNILDQIAQYASSLAPQMMNWASNVFAQTSQITSEAVGNFFNASQQMTGLAGNMIGQYNNLFAPENAQLVADANSYASPARMATDMGMAGATAAQAGDQGIKNSEQNLLSYGIDPSAGRYAALDKASAVQNAANVAGAENTQRMADINTGQQLRAEAVQTGSLLPGAISNAENTAIQANAGASNATLANANTGANLMSLADKYLSTAMGLKLSPVGQNSSSTGTSSNHGSSNGGGGGGGARGGGGGAGPGGGGGGPAWMPNHTGFQNDGGLGTNPGAHIMPGPGIQDTGGGNGNSADPFGTGTGSIGQPTTDPLAGLSDPNGLGGAGVNDTNPFSDPGFGQNFDPSGQGWGTFGGGSSSDPSGGITDPGNSWAGGGMGNNTYDPSANPAPSDWPSYSPSAWPTDTGGGGSSADTSGASPIDTSSFDTSGGDPFAGYAQGGSVQPAPTTGGYVNPQMSPSAGAQTDDVNAHLNAREFVVPQDVADWKGQEFFHKLIAQSRANRNTITAQSPVGPKPAMQRGGPAAFTSQRVG